jgi:hypothetical protein
MELNRITKKIIGCAIEVHKHPGPGLLESAYEECHVIELLTYMKFAQKSIGLLINFNVTVLKNGIKRYKI